MKIFQKTIYFLSKIVYPCKVYGKENIPNGKAIFAFNHLSVIDPVYVLRTYKKFDVTCLAKKELFESKLFSKIIKSFGALPVDRDNPSLKVVAESLRALKNDKKLLLAPEGTRNKTGDTELLPFKSGVMMFAYKTNAPICPIIIFKKAKIFRRNKMIIGSPIYLEDFYDEKPNSVDYDEMAEILRNKMILLQSELYKVAGKK